MPRQVTFDDFMTVPQKRRIQGKRMKWFYVTTHGHLEVDEAAREVELRRGREELLRRVDHSDEHRFIRVPEFPYLLMAAPRYRYMPRRVIARVTDQKSWQ
jgi:hypothetical protein